ncbi:MAG: hypothetical protein HY698_19275 [Deltaproteobacteria bacterium]|nr:hypothetical protein [Deltaproteobacteria bacterium]
MKTVFDSVNKMEAVMGFHRDRHSVLAGNVANLDTPGYVPFDLTLERLPESEAENHVPVARTHGNHIPVADPVTPPGVRVTFEDRVRTPGGDGNAVTLERELAKVDANRVRYTATSEMVSRRLALLRYTASEGG